MVVVTGGAGFIGSVLVWSLNRGGRRDILVVDRLGTGQKWRNLVGLDFEHYEDKDSFIASLEAGRYDDRIDTIIHLGACSSTTESDADYLMRNNYDYSVRLGTWWDAHRSVRFVYASSGATYGNGAQGYVDDESRLHTLRPMNMYGYSKHLFDLHALRRGWLGSMVGLKYFNVFGPNENHKGPMRSVINKAFPRARDEGVMALFRSGSPRYADGESDRDFVYVKDAVAMTLFFVDNPAVGGLYNVGTGRARTWNDVARALLGAVGKEPRIEYIDMPPELIGSYQYHTEADTGKLRRAGCTHECMSLEDAVDDYVQNYLLPGKRVAEAAANDDRSA
ncbi:MAG: ADP-glyceromanno-heptose 6-epimerase [Chitinivibrionales bacterium]|nr:ADP-glyceromanno-heptose 6-epimerase [Chitinivibrionales bacterium]